MDEWMDVWIIKSHERFIYMYCQITQIERHSVSRVSLTFLLRYQIVLNNMQKPFRITKDIKFKITPDFYQTTHCIKRQSWEGRLQGYHISAYTRYSGHFVLIILCLCCFMQAYVQIPGLMLTVLCLSQRFISSQGLKLQCLLFFC